MDIPSPEDVLLDQVTQELISDATELTRQVNELRPLSREVVENILKELLGERVYNSNAIEGNTLTLRETKSILQSGEIVDVGRKREATEVINLGKAISQVQEMVEDPGVWSDFTRFTALHKTLLTDIMDHAAGVIRNERVMIGGARHQPPSPQKLDGALDEFFRRLKNASDIEPIWLATWAHWSIARIHPFLDGNGRMARLWQDLILFSHKLTAAVIRQRDRDEYYSALGSADDGDFNPLTQLVARSLGRTFQIYINAQREVDELKDWAVEIVGESNERIDEKRKLEYIRWARQMELLRDAFQRCAIQVTNASDGTIDMQVHSFDIIDQPTWETLRSGGHASKASFFTIVFRRRKEWLQYSFFFDRQLGSPTDYLGKPIGARVSLHVSEQRPGGLPSELGMTSSPFTFSELLVAKGTTVVNRSDSLTVAPGLDIGIDPLKVAREFVQFVLLNRMP